MANEELLREYRKERKRVRDLIRRMKKRGYIDLDDILPPIPKKITKGSIRRLQELTPRKLQEKSRYVTETGEIVSGRKGRLLEIKKASKKGQETVRKKRPKRPESEKEPGKGKSAGSGTGGRMPDEKDIIKRRIRGFITQYSDENDEGAKEILDEFDRIIADQESKEDGGQAFYDKLKEREEELCISIDMALHYKSSSSNFKKHFSDVKRILQECANASGSDFIDPDDDFELPFN